MRRNTIFWSFRSGLRFWGPPYRCTTATSYYCKT